MSRNRGLLSCVLGIVAIAALTAVAYRLPNPRIDSPARPQSPTAFSTYRALSELESLVGNGIAHPLGSEENARLRTSIVRGLSAMGYRTQIQSGFVCNVYATCGTPSNILAWLPARQTSSDAAYDAELVLLAAHYDSVPAGPGASDDAAGVATLLEIARILTLLPPTRHPIALLITDGEEAGLLGALLFVRDQPVAKRVAAAVNLEARGSSGPSLMFETGSANSWLMSLYRSAVARPITDSVYYDAYQTLPNSTDFTVFKASDWQGFNFAFIGDVAHYHTALDTVANTDVRSVRHQGDNALASLLALADSGSLRSRPASDAVYFDVASRLLIAWPASYSLIVSIAALVLLLIESVLQCRSHQTSARQIAWGGLGAVMTLVLGGVSSTVILALLLKSGKVPPLTQYSWIAHPAWMSVACTAWAAAAAGISGHWFARRAGFWGFWLGTVWLFAVLGAVLALLRPGMGFLPLITVVVAVLAGLPATARSRTWQMDLAALAPAWVACALLIPLISLLYAALGSIAWILDTLLLSLGATLLLPLLASASTALRRRFTGIASGASILGVLMTVMLPTYSAAWPQRLNFRYRMDASRHQAVWLAEPDSLQLPASIAKSADFAAEAITEYPDGHSRAFETPAPLLDLSAPMLTLRSTAAGSGGTTRYVVHLQSSRGAPEVGVVFPAVAKIHEIILSDAGGERRVPLYEAPSGMTHLLIFGLAPQGMDFAVEAQGASLQARLFDQSYALEGGEFLQRLRTHEATSSQDGDTTIVQNTVTLDPAAGR